MGAHCDDMPGRSQPAEGPRHGEGHRLIDVLPAFVLG